MLNHYEILVLETNKSPKDYRGLVAVNDKNEFIVISTTNDCKLVDLFINGYEPDYNAIECDEKLTVGLYEMRFSPWSQQSYEGDYDCGINATVINKIGEISTDFK